MKVQLDPRNFEACPDFNRWLDERYVDLSGVLDIHGFQPRPSFVLFTMSPVTYQAAFGDYQEERETDLKEVVFAEFPSPIAHYFYRFERGFENELQRLHLLRDTWEAVVDILHAAAIAECRIRRVALAEPVVFSDLLSESVTQRLLNFERIVERAEGLGIQLSVARIAAKPTLTAMRELSLTRIGLSDSVAQTERQAQLWILDCYGDVLSVLDDLQGLAGMRILRYIGPIDGHSVRCERFKGHGFAKTIEALPLTSEHRRESQRYLRIGQVLVTCEDWLSSLRPLVSYREDATRSTTKLCVFRKTRGAAPNECMEYQVVGEAGRHEEGSEQFEPELDDLRKLFDLPSDPSVAASASPGASSIQAPVTLTKHGEQVTATPPCDVGIITIKDEEFEAVLAAFGDESGVYVAPTSKRHYNLRRADAGGGKRYSVAIVRNVEQGNGDAQSVARDMIEDLGPGLILVVGIAGARPTSDFTLGDVVLSLRVNDYSVHAVNVGSDTAYAVSGGPVATAIAAGVANLRARGAALGDWTSTLPTRPTIDIDTARIVGPDEWQDSIRKSVRQHFGEKARAAPKFVSGAIGSSDGLIKEPKVLITWLSTARNLLAVEMESAGVHKAARDRCSWLAIRGISDIVGLERSDEWTLYAAATAAAFARAYLRTTPIEPSD
jgi:nucleoside phosphorylase